MRLSEHCLQINSTKHNQSYDFPLNLPLPFTGGSVGRRWETTAILFRWSNRWSSLSQCSISLSYQHLGLLHTFGTTHLQISRPTLDSAQGKHRHHMVMIRNSTSPPRKLKLMGPTHHTTRWIHLDRKVTVVWYSLLFMQLASAWAALFCVLLLSAVCGCFLSPTVKQHLPVSTFQNVNKKFIVSRKKRFVSNQSFLSKKMFCVTKKNSRFPAPQKSAHLRAIAHESCIPFQPPCQNADFVFGQSISAWLTVVRWCVSIFPSLDSVDDDPFTSDTLDVDNAYDASIRCSAFRMFVWWFPRQSRSLLVHFDGLVFRQSRTVWWTCSQTHGYPYQNGACRAQRSDGHSCKHGFAVKQMLRKTQGFLLSLEFPWLRNSGEAGRRGEQEEGEEVFFLLPDWLCAGKRLRQQRRLLKDVTELAGAAFESFVIKVVSFWSLHCFQGWPVLLIQPEPMWCSFSVSGHLVNRDEGSSDLHVVWFFFLFRALLHHYFDQNTTSARESKLNATPTFVVIFPAVHLHMSRHAVHT